MPRMTTSRRATQHKVDINSASDTLRREQRRGRSLYRCSRHTNLVYGGVGPRCPVCDIESSLESANEERLEATRRADNLHKEVGMLKAVNEHSSAMSNAVKEMTASEQAILRDMVYAHVTDDLRQVRPKVSKEMVREKNLGSYRKDKIVGIEYRFSTNSEWQSLDPESIGAKAFLLPFFESMKVAGTKRTMHHLLIALKHSSVDVDVLMEAANP